MTLGAVTAAAPSGASTAIDRALAGITAGESPDFVCVGMQKAGTGWLFDQLARHPGVWTPPIKELHVLDGGRTPKLAEIVHRYRGDPEGYNRWRARRGFRPMTDEDADFISALVARRKDDGAADYGTLFALKRGRIAGDITPAYATLDEAAIARFVAAYPKALVFLFVREPVDRFWSQVSMMARANPERMARGGRDPAGWDAVSAVLRSERAAERSSPSKIARRWRRHVPADRFVLEFFDDLRDDAEAFRRRILARLGLDPAALADAIEGDFNRKAGSIKLPLSDDVRARLAAHFAEEIRSSAAELGGRAAEWPARYGL